MILTGEKQHRHCYGYIVDVINLPEQHICYGCLLDSEGSRYAALQSLAEVRRVLWALHEGKGGKTRDAVGKQLGCGIEHPAFLDSADVAYVDRIRQFRVKASTEAAGDAGLLHVGEPRVNDLSC